MADLQNRTLICSVLFIDIVEYSRKPVVEQIELKDRFNALISEALRGVAVNDRIILDTGDGAAISFIGDPEDALFVATGLRDDIAAHPENADVELSTRMGINLGPVRLVRDINGQPNIIGDGINVAQRVMSFAKPGQVLVSRSYYEVVSRLSDESSRLFSYEGSRTDNHIREHEVYAVGAIPAPHRRSDDAEKKRGRGRSTPARDMWARVAHTIAAFLHRIVARPRLATALAVAAILVIALAARGLREPPRSGEVRLRAPAPPPAPAVEPAGRPDDKLAIATGTAPRKSPAAPAQAAAPEMPRVLPVIPRTPAKTLAAPDSAPAAAADDPAAVALADPAVLSLAIAPWGQIFVDGRSRGVSPPLQEVELAPGRHRIEVRNSAAPTHVVNVNAKPGERLRIKHKFN
jgi:class 3 adenylate cyclase